MWFGVWQHMVSKTEQSLLNKIDLPQAVESVSWILEHPHDDRRWKEAIYMSRKENAAKLAMVRNNYRITS